jgi:hypothetical protein
MERQAMPCSVAENNSEDSPSRYMDITVGDLLELSQLDICDWAPRKTSHTKILVTDLKELNSFALNCVSPVGYLHYNLYFPNALLVESVKHSNRIQERYSSKNIRRLLGLGKNPFIYLLLGNLLSVHSDTEPLHANDRFFKMLEFNSQRLRSYFLPNVVKQEVISFFASQIDLQKEHAVLEFSEHRALDMGARNFDGANYLSGPMISITPEQWLQFETHVAARVEIEPIRYLKPVLLMIDPTQDLSRVNHQRLFEYRLSILRQLCSLNAVAAIRDEQLNSTNDFVWGHNDFDGRQAIVDLINERLSDPMFLDWNQGVISELTKHLKQPEYWP